MTMFLRDREEEEKHIDISQSHTNFSVNGANSMNRANFYLVFRINKKFKY